MGGHYSFSSFGCEVSADGVSELFQFGRTHILEKMRQFGRKVFAGIHSDPTITTCKRRSGFPEQNRYAMASDFRIIDPVVFDNSLLATPDFWSASQSERFLDNITIGTPSFVRFHFSWGPYSFFRTYRTFQWLRVSRSSEAQEPIEHSNHNDFQTDFDLRLSDNSDTERLLVIYA